MGNPFRLPMVVETLKGLVSPPATRRYPDEKRAPFTGARGALTVDMSSCVLCGICERRCPCAAIIVSREAKTLTVEYLRCVSCGVCVEACNKHSLGLASEPLEVQVEPVSHHRVELHKPG